MVGRALYQKYAASQNYFYSREVNEIMQSGRTRSLIRYRDGLTYDECEEYMKRTYARREFREKIGVLSEYYKFHRDVPRVFMMPISITLSKYHDRKRRIEYVRITRMLNIAPMRCDSKDEPHKSMECLLDQLDLTKKKQSEQSSLYEINQRLTELIGAQSPHNPYFPNNHSISLFHEEEKHLHMPMQPKAIVVPPVLFKKNENKLNIKAHINNFFQITEQQKQALSHREQVVKKITLSPTPPPKQASNTHRPQTPAQFLAKSKPATASSRQSVGRNTMGNTIGSNTQIQGKDDLLKLLQRNPANSHQGSASVERRSAGRESAKQKQDPLISQLIERLQEGNSNLFQQLVQLTHIEKQRFEPEDSRGSVLKVSLGKSSNSSNLGSMLKQSVSQRIKQNLTTNNSQSRNSNSRGVVNRTKRVNSQNMDYSQKESNPFHLNLERVNQNSQQRVQTSCRETARDLYTSRPKVVQTTYESLINQKKVRQRVFSHSNGTYNDLLTQPKQLKTFSKKV